MNKSTLSIAHILQVLHRLPVPGNYWLAYSGGMDSTALLSILSEHRDNLKAELIAVHVNHQLSVNATQWENHCRNFCSERDIRYKSVSIDVCAGRNSSQEAWARELRYAALGSFVRQDDILLTAHHRDDLAETVIQQLLRGSGPEGLSAMPEIRRFGKGWLVRPLLTYGRTQIADHVRSRQLTWVEDESNADQGIDRNYLRNTVMPCLRERWPSAADVLWRVSRLQADVAVVLNDMAAYDMLTAAGKTGVILRRSAVDKLSLPRQRNLLRYWIKKTGHPVPSMGVVDKIIHELMHARPDGMPCIRWSGAEIRRYRDDIYIMPANKFAPPDPGPFLWSLDKPLDIWNGRLEARLAVGSGIRAKLLHEKKLEVRYRKGGEYIRPAGRKETHELKKLFQEAGVPPWKRDAAPLLYAGNELAAVVGHWIAEGFNATGNEQGWEIIFVEKQD